MFLHYLLNESEKSLLNKFIKKQMEEPSKNDWIESIESDLEVLDISLSFADIKELSTYQFKNFVDKQTEEKARNCSTVKYFTLSMKH